MLPTVNVRSADKKYTAFGNKKKSLIKCTFFVILKLKNETYKKAERKFGKGFLQFMD